MLKYNVELEVRFPDCGDSTWDKVLTVNARVGDDTASEEEDERIFFYYETFEEILQNDEEFTVLSINGTDINEFYA